MFNKPQPGTSSMRSPAVKPWGTFGSQRHDDIDTTQRNRWVRNVQRLYGVDRDEATSVVDDVIRTMAVVDATDRR